MKATITFLGAVLLLEVIVGLPYAVVKVTQHLYADRTSYVHVSQDIPRACLSQCDKKVVDGYSIVDNKLQCVCK